MYGQGGSRSINAKRLHSKYYISVIIATVSKLFDQDNLTVVCLREISLTNLTKKNTEEIEEQ